MSRYPAPIHATPHFSSTSFRTSSSNPLSSMVHSIEPLPPYTFLLTKTLQRRCRKHWTFLGAMDCASVCAAKKAAILIGNVAQHLWPAHGRQLKPFAFHPKRQPRRRLQPMQFPASPLTLTKGRQRLSSRTDRAHGSVAF